MSIQVCSSFRIVNNTICANHILFLFNSCFDWNPEKAPSDSLYYITKENKIPVKATVEQKQNVVRANSVVYNSKRTAYLYQHDGDIFYKEIKPDKIVRITHTEETEYNPQFSFGEKEIVYNHNQNLFSWNISTGETRQLTNFTNGDDKKKEEKLSPEDEWLKKDQIQIHAGFTGKKR